MLLENVDLLGHGARRHAQFLGGATDAAGAADDFEDFDGPQGR